MKSWMRKLAGHYNRIRNLYPEDNLLILFDIDGTILDMRYMIYSVLKSFDQNKGTHFFQNLKITDIRVHENQIIQLLDLLKIGLADQETILSWYFNHRWTSKAILESHRPFSGVMEVIRWFQMQPNTEVGLNTGRPSFVREDTLLSLNRLGESFKVHFDPQLLYMNPETWEKRVDHYKVEGVKHFLRQGFRVFAIVDNELDNLHAITKCEDIHDVLLLHADTIFESQRTTMPEGTVSGKQYDLTELIPERSLPKHIQFVWHGVNDEANLRQFLISNVSWAEMNVRYNPWEHEIILRHDKLERPDDLTDDNFLSLDYCLKKMKKHQKKVKVDLKDGAKVIDGILDRLSYYHFSDDQIWFNANIKDIKENGFRTLKMSHPHAIIQCPIDFLIPLLSTSPDKLRDLLLGFQGWGINRFSISWPEILKFPQILDQLTSWGMAVNIYKVPDLESFLKAVLLLPQSITSDFNFPKWNYFGRGSGENTLYHQYTSHFSSSI